MTDYDAATYGEQIADIYDARYGGRLDTDATVAFLAELAAGGAVLELGIGTGRVALPLAERGVEIHGIDASEAMVVRLRAKPGGADIPVTIGDFAEVGVEGQFSLVFVVFNTFFALLTQDDQVRCFRNVAAHLAEGGRFVVEAFVPNLARFVRDQNCEVVRADADGVDLDVARHDRVQQRITAQHVVIGGDGIRLYPVRLRYAWPSELDLMARLAGLRLRERWGGWRREPFSASSTQHVSVYERGNGA